MHEAFQQSQQAFSQLNDCVQENISGIRLLRAYGLESQAISQFDQKAAHARDTNLAVIAAEAKYGPVIFIVVGISFLFAVSGGAWFITQGSMSIGELTSFTLYLGYLIWPMFAYGWLLNLLERGTVAYARVQALLNSNEHELPAGNQTLTASATLQWHIPVFSWPKTDVKVLEGIDGQLAPGKTLGIVGPTGAGKSTLLKLLTYQIPVSAHGYIRLDGQTFDQYRTESLRQHMAIIPQEPFLFSATIAENIAMGKPGASLDEIRLAARLACIEDDILLFPDQFQTLVGERGVTLSGGQKQRLAIARALLMDAAILVLDDALSAVDMETENAILAHLRKTRKNRTTLIVCHRLSAVKHADEIIVLKQGRVTERGNHSQLLDHQGWYARMHEYQQIEQAVIEGH
jgi:ABC-type multidrug transport system fused ATPase/permease subunit